jgi:hypothetical protein
MSRLSLNGRVLAVLLGVFVVGDILLSPLGFETRGAAILSNPASLPWFGLLIGGLVLNIVSLILIFFRAHIASALALVGSVVYIVPLLWRPGRAPHSDWAPTVAKTMDVQDTHGRGPLSRLMVPASTGG